MRRSIGLITALLVAQAQAAPWVRMSNGLPDRFVDAQNVEHNVARALAVLGGDLYVGLERGGVYRSSDGGANWTPTPANPTLDACDVTQMVAVAPNVFAACRFPGGVFRYDTSQPAPAWQQVVTNLSGTARNGDAIVAVGNTLYYAAFGPRGVAGPGVWRSVDAGDTWVRVVQTGMEDQNVYALAYDGTWLYAGTMGDNLGTNFGVAYRLALPDGLAWTRINQGFDPNGAYYDSVFAMTAVPGRVFAGTDDKGFYRSLDAGDHWTKVADDTVGDVYGAIVAGPQVFFGTLYGGVYRSDDGGATFVSNSDGIAYGAQTAPMVARHFALLDGGVYVATDLGVFRQQLAATPSETLFLDGFE